MQKLLIGLLVLTTAALGVLCAVQRKQLRAVNDKVQAVEQARSADTETREMQSARVRELERSEARLEKQLQEFTKVTTTLRATEARQSSNLTTFAERMRAAKSKGGASNETEGGALSKGMGEMLGKMMKDPAMREMLREQQKATIGMMYSGLFKDLNLTPDEKEKFRALLTDAQMRTLENAQGLFGGNDQQGSTADAAKQSVEAKKQTDAEIKALLGDERFALYEDYQKNMGERMQLDQFKNQITGDMPLRDEQSAQLMQILKEEKSAVPPIIPTDQTQMPNREHYTAENIEKQIQWVEDYNRRVVARAQSVLSPEQFKQYQAFQEQQVSMQRLGMNMARQMFGGEKGSGAPAAPPPK